MAKGKILGGSPGRDHRKSSTHIGKDEPTNSGKKETSLLSARLSPAQKETAETRETEGSRSRTIRGSEKS